MSWTDWIKVVVPGQKNAAPDKLTTAPKTGVPGLRKKLGWLVASLLMATSALWTNSATNSFQNINDALGVVAHVFGISLEAASKLVREAGIAEDTKIVKIINEQEVGTGKLSVRILTFPNRGWDIVITKPETK